MIPPSQHSDLIYYFSTSPDDPPRPPKVEGLGVTERGNPQPQSQLLPQHPPGSRLLSTWWGGLDRSGHTSWHTQGSEESPLQGRGRDVGAQGRSSRSPGLGVREDPDHAHPWEAAG